MSKQQIEERKTRTYEYDTTGRLGFSYSKLEKARSYIYDGLGNRMGIKEYEMKICYRYDNVVNIYFVQAREYVAGVGQICR